MVELPVCTLRAAVSSDAMLPCLRERAGSPSRCSSRGSAGNRSLTSPSVSAASAAGAFLHPASSCHRSPHSGILALGIVCLACSWLGCHEVGQSLGSFAAWAVYNLLLSSVVAIKASITGWGAGRAWRGRLGPSALEKVDSSAGDRTTYAGNLGHLVAKCVHAAHRIKSGQWNRQPRQQRQRRPWSCGLPRTGGRRPGIRWHGQPAEDHSHQHLHAWSG